MTVDAVADDRYLQGVLHQGDGKVGKASSRRQSWAPPIEYLVQAQVITLVLLLS